MLIPLILYNISLFYVRESGPSEQGVLGPSKFDGYYPSPSWTWVGFYGSLVRLTFFEILKANGVLWNHKIVGTIYIRSHISLNSYKQGVSEKSNIESDEKLSFESVYITWCQYLIKPINCESRDTILSRFSNILTCTSSPCGLFIAVTVKKRHIHMTMSVSLTNVYG